MSYPYHSPPPPPPSPVPKCNMTTPNPPPPPPPFPCNHRSPPPPPPPPPRPLPPPSPPPPPPSRPPSQPSYYTPYQASPIPTPGGGDNHTTYIAVFVSLGGVFFLAFLAAGLFFLAKKRNKKLPVVPPAACVEEHQRLHESITTGPCGEKTVTLTIDDDVQLHQVGGTGASNINVGNDPAAAGCHSVKSVDVRPSDHGHR